ncbi:MAG TPA: hypothetical protein VN762_11715 [Steroidobacteraceae bacterium]|nr:hypothetical protein [Steroidobacteraceae bacterium]
MTSGTAGYSGTALAKKLGIEEGSMVFAIGQPEDYVALLAPLPPAVRFGKTLAADVDLVHLFTADAAELEMQLPRILSKLRADAVIWVSWPTKAAKVPTDLTEDVIRAVALPLGLVDTQVCAVNEVWSGLKLVIGKSLRK